jgi:uncharacterized YigZ family protein
VQIVTQFYEMEDVIKKSRFIGVINPCASERDALMLIKRLHEQHPTASHVVYAYRIQTAEGLVCRFNDAGEPSGTAGKPIFQHLEGKQLINLVLAVVRYFGGVKLGAGGLTRAYSGVAKQVIEAANIIDYVEMAELKLLLPYGQLQFLEYQLKKLEGEILAQNFAQEVSLSVRLPKKHCQQLLESFQ